MHRRSFMKSVLAASTALGTSVPMMAFAGESVSVPLLGQMVDITLKSQGDNYLAIFGLADGNYADRIRMNKGSFDDFAGLGQKDGQKLNIDGYDVTLKDGGMTVIGNGLVKAFEIPPTANLHPIIVIIIVIIIIHGKWPPMPKLVRMNGAEMEIGY